MKEEKMLELADTLSEAFGHTYIVEMVGRNYQLALRPLHPDYLKWRPVLCGLWSRA
jgi:hypothetical protein